MKEFSGTSGSSGSFRLDGSECFNGGQKHHFRPRYQEVESSCNDFTGGDIVSLADEMSGDEIRALQIKYTYVHDVCQWCGKVNA